MEFSEVVSQFNPHRSWFFCLSFPLWLASLIVISGVASISNLDGDHIGLPILLSKSVEGAST